MHLEKVTSQLLWFYRPKTEVLCLWSQLLVFVAGSQAQPQSCAAPEIQTLYWALDVSGPGDCGVKAASECKLCGDDDDDDDDDDN